MRYIKRTNTVELTARNVTALLAKLDDRLSARTLISPDDDFVGGAIENNVSLDSAEPPKAVPVHTTVTLTRDDLWYLTTPGATLTHGAFTLRSVTDEAHYSDRAPGAVYMPESGVQW
ncbi:Uncharacterised protein [Mycobacteroides abscessus]|nr:Uncharacterised protein [Mycobacteroides abscessus]